MNQLAVFQPNHPLAAAALSEIAYIFDMVADFTPEQQRIKARITECVVARDLNRAVRLIDNGVPLLSKSRKRGVLTVEARRWVSQWRRNVQRFIYDDLAQAERIAA